ncbi:chitin deacetylase [Physocladia obscura]|uniref:Chitin deacetylase n=1 Tax=Physocladia obscura TaxID=109957 RepID=A0AAD5XF26_9FUNG|nr:chitin deacetylase [Physocladia obscura]
MEKYAFDNSTWFSWALDPWAAAPAVPVWTEFFARAMPNPPVLDDISQCNSNLPKAWAATYDDGPSDYTYYLPVVVYERSIKTTFFVIGSCIINSPDVLLSTFNAGHEISLHTWSHPDLTTISDDQIISELVYAAKAVYTVTGVFPKYFRPPYGSVDARVRSVAATMGVRSVVYEADSRDWQYWSDPATLNTTIPPEFEAWISQNVTNQISLEHEMFEPEAQIAPTVLAILLDAGYNLMPVHECQGDPNPYNNTILESFFLSGQFKNQTTLVPQVALLSTTKTTRTSATMTKPLLAQTGEAGAVATTNTSGQYSRSKEVYIILPLILIMILAFIF